MSTDEKSAWADAFVTQVTEPGGHFYIKAVFPTQQAMRDAFDALASTLGTAPRLLPIEPPVSPAEHVAVVAERDELLAWRAHIEQHQKKGKRPFSDRHAQAVIADQVKRLNEAEDRERDRNFQRLDAIARAEAAEAGRAEAMEVLKPFAAASEEADRLLVEAQRSLHRDADSISDGDLAELVSPSSSIRMAGVTPTAKAVITTGDLRRAAQAARTLIQSATTAGEPQS